MSADKQTIDWLVATGYTGKAQALLRNAREDRFIMKLLKAEDPNLTWRANHDRDLHSIATMTEAIVQYFKISGTENVPYLYRYFIPASPETSEAAKFAEYVLNQETRFARKKKIALIGRRIVASLA